jgi:hypothetical protein
MTEQKDRFRDFLQALVTHWWARVTGPLLTLGLLVSGKFGWHVADEMGWVILGAVVLLPASYFAWRDERRKALELENKLPDLTVRPIHTFEPEGTWHGVQVWNDGSPIRLKAKLRLSSGGRFPLWWESSKGPETELGMDDEDELYFGAVWFYDEKASVRTGTKTEGTTHARIGLYTPEGENKIGNEVLFSPNIPIGALHGYDLEVCLSSLSNTILREQRVHRFRLDMDGLHPTPSVSGTATLPSRAGAS